MQKQLPDNWTAGIGERSTKYYDKWFYNGNLELHVYWDEGSEHKVELLEVLETHDNGDPAMYGYPEPMKQLDTENEAIEYAFELMEQYS